MPIIFTLALKNGVKPMLNMRRLGKKAILFVMTDDTKNCDDVKEYLESSYPEFKDAVLVIHTKNNGEISESDSQKDKEELGKSAQSSRTRLIAGIVPTRSLFPS